MIGSPIASSGPSELEKKRMALWSMPAPRTRREFLERKDLTREIDNMERDEWKKTYKAGYENLMSIRGTMKRGD